MSLSQGFSDVSSWLDSGDAFGGAGMPPKWCGDPSQDPHDLGPLIKEIAKFLPWNSATVSLWN